MAERQIEPTSFSDIPTDLDPRVQNLFAELQQAIDLREGRIAPGSNTRFVTIQDLVDAGVVSNGVIE